VRLGSREFGPFGKPPFKGDRDEKKRKEKATGFVERILRRAGRLFQNASYKKRKEEKSSKELREGRVFAGSARYVQGRKREIPKKQTIKKWLAEETLVSMGKGKHSV